MVVFFVVFRPKVGKRVWIWTKSIMVQHVKHSQRKTRRLPNCTNALNNTLLLPLRIGKNCIFVLPKERRNKTNTLKMKILQKIKGVNSLVCLLALTTLLVPAKLLGQSELTVYDGGNSNTFVPYSYEYRQQWQKCEFVIPAVALADMGANAQVGMLISEMTFYYGAYGYYTELCTFKVFVEEVGFESFEGQTSFHGYDNAMLVYDGRLNYHYGEVKVSFNENFAYHGGNLLIGVYPTKTQYYYEGSYPFYGTTVANAAMEGYSNDPDNIPASIIDFIPKTTFVYYDEDYCFAPKDLDYDGYSLTSTSVTLDWTPVGSEQEWKIKYTDEEGNETVVDDITEHPYTLTGLQPGTSYQNISVCAVCGVDNESDWTVNYYGFTTLFCEPEDQCELHYELRSTEEGWGWGWDNYITVSYKRGEDDYVTVEELRLVNGTLKEGDLALCDGLTYDFDWTADDPSALTYISFVITDPYGNPIDDLDYSNGGVPEESTTLLEGFTMDCPSCKKPRNFSATTAPTSASFIWTADSGQMEWQFQYSTDQTTWSTVQTVTGTPSCSINNLDPATQYFARVRANCGDGDYSPWAVISFYTDCATLVIDAEYPYSENFDSYDPYDPYGGGEWKGMRMEVTEKLPLCWSSWNGSDDYQQSIYPYIDYDWESESNVLKFYVYNYEGEGAMFDQYAILPAMEDVDGLMMSFRAKDYESSTSDFSIGVMTDPTDPTTFVEVQTFEATEEWNNFVVYFDAYQGQGEYIAIKIATPGEYESYNLYIDDIEVAMLPTCFVPSELEASDVLVNEATLSWTPYGDETAWQVRYSTDQNTWTTVDYEEQNPGETVTKQLTGLSANTLYYVQVRANCDNEDYSVWSSMTQFRTDCGTYQPVPYYENFESYSSDEDQPSCWSRINTTSNASYPYITRDGYQIFYDDDTPNSASYRFYIYNNSSAGDALYGILPKMQDINTLQMRFDAKGSDDDYWNSYSSRFQVGVMTDPEDESTFTVILNEQENFHSELRSFTVSFADYQGSEGHIAIKVVKESGNDSWLVIDNIAVEPVVHKTIEGYTADDNGWYLIASPVVGSISPLKVDNMLNGNFDLYAFDQNAEGAEWQNYQAHQEGFMLQNGQGYLYANSGDVTLGFAGAMQPNQSVTVTLAYTDGKPYAGWNLVGNPFDGTATLVGDPDYYRINGNLLVASTGEIGVCEGIFVQATAINQSVTFQRAATQGEPEPSDGLSLSLYNNTSRRLDLARIRFSEGDNLGKLDLLSDPNKLFIPLDGKEYAVVHAGAVGEMPLSFMAAENGRYTLAVNLEEVEMSYLHLIDNLTGADIDLLETPSYTFEARMSDYSSRFRLVFRANDASGASTSSATFAFFDGNSWQVNNTGAATLQVIDVLGRIVSSQTINGNATLGTDNLGAGVYVMRLVNGDEVKVQKVVVR